ncbi:hypothetical protein FRC02_002779 [Tulasnella sp. 418]|nr:hypothetical protein FRC02_002779 [Tulasnella sp. 418]
MPRLGGGRRYESGKVVSEAANLKAPSSQEDIDILRGSDRDLQTSAVKSQRVYEQQLADVESTIERLRLIKSEKDAELQYLRKQNESLNASCRIYLEERNAAKIKNEGYLAKIKDLEMECAQMNDIVVRPEREMVSDCGGKKVSVMYESKGEGKFLHRMVISQESYLDVRAMFSGTPENAIGEELQVQERVATAATTTLPT